MDRLDGRRVGAASATVLLSLLVAGAMAAVLVEIATDLGAMAAPESPRVESHPFGGKIRPALFVQSIEQPDAEPGWARLATTIELVQLADAMKEEALSLQEIAQAIVEQGRVAEPDDEAPGDSDRVARAIREVRASRAELAAVELELSGKVVEAAQQHAQRARHAFGLAWAEVVRKDRDGRAPEPGTFYCRSDSIEENDSKLPATRWRM